MDDLEFIYRATNSLASGDFDAQTGVYVAETVSREIARYQDGTWECVPYCGEDA